MTTFGDRFPRLLEDPRWADLAARPYYEPGEVPAEPPPGLMTMAGNVARAAARFVGSGLKVAPPEVQAERLAICSACPNWIAGGRRCSLCGCMTDYKIKMASERCPAEPPRWPAM